MLEKVREPFFSRRVVATAYFQIDGNFCAVEMGKLDGYDAQSVCQGLLAATDHETSGFGKVDSAGAVQGVGTT
jgi:hypothetical protein